MVPKLHGVQGAAAAARRDRWHVFDVAPLDIPCGRVRVSPGADAAHKPVVGHPHPAQRRFRDPPAAEDVPAPGARRDLERRVVMLIDFYIIIHFH